jgi:hypothetical protein
MGGKHVQRGCLSFITLALAGCRTMCTELQAVVLLIASVSA